MKKVRGLLYIRFLIPEELVIRVGFLRRILLLKMVRDFLYT